MSTYPNTSQQQQQKRSLSDKACVVLVSTAKFLVPGLNKATDWSAQDFGPILPDWYVNTSPMSRSATQAKKTEKISKLQTRTSVEMDLRENQLSLQTNKA